MITHICIEIRKALGCANVYLQFDQSLAETEFLKINIDDVQLGLKELSTEVKIITSNYFKIEAAARTINNLVIEECNASFRLTICDIKLETNLDNDLAAAGAFTPRLSIKEDSTVNMCCNTCKRNLIEKQQVQRIREFPDGPLNISDFFCHAHHHNHHDDEGGQHNLQDALVPQVTDIFYGFYFIVVNKELMYDKIKLKDKHIYCRRCLQYLGETLMDGRAFKLWTETLLQSDDSSNEQYKPLNENLILRPTCQLIRKIIKDSSDVPDAHLRQFHYSKNLIEATFPNRKAKYLMLHILEKNVQVLRNSKPLTSSGYNNNNIQIVELEKFKCFKLLYRFVSNDCDSNDGEESSLPPLLKLWQDDLTTLSQKISPMLFTSLLQELEENTLLLPEYYRYSRDQFQLSFMFYNN